MEQMTLVEVAKRFSDEAAAWEYVEQLRWQGHPVCPHCGSDDVFYLEPRSGAPRTTRTGRETHRRVWKCRNKECKRQFSALVGTIFEGSKIPLAKWIMAIYLMVAGKNGVAALELQRDLGITYKSAWFMVHRIRKAMENSPKGSKLRGVVVMDEAFVGPTASKMNAKARAKRDPIGGPTTGKTPVFTIVDKVTGEIRSQVVKDIKTNTLSEVIDENVNKLGSILWTDEGSHYTSIGRRFVKHQTVNHSEGIYYDAETGATTNLAECYFGQLKRAIVGTHHGVADEHWAATSKSLTSAGTHATWPMVSVPCALSTAQRGRASVTSR